MGESVSDEKIDLVIMRTKGASNLQEILVGSNTEKVVRLVKLTVLAVQEKPDRFDLKNVILAVNLEEDYTKFMEQLKTWQTIFGFTLHILHVNTSLNFDATANIEKRMHMFEKKHHLQNYTFTIE